MFLQVGKEPIKKQRLYLMEITLPSGLTLVKVGKASGENSTSRMMQIVESIYQKSRRTPMIYVKKDQEVPADLVFKYETILHKYFSDYQYTSPYKFSGHTECFTIPLADGLMAYEAVLAGHVPDSVYIMPDQSEKDGLQF